MATERRVARKKRVRDRQVADRQVTDRRRAASDRLHPLVYKAIAACILIFAWSVCGFAEDGHVAYLIAVVTGFVLISGLLPWVLWRVWRRNGADAKERRREDFDEWASGDFVTWQSRLRGWEADRPDPAADRGRGARNGGFRYSRALRLRAVTDGPLENAPAGSSARDGISPPP